LTGAPNYPVVKLIGTSDAYSKLMSAPLFVITIAAIGIIAIVIIVSSAFAITVLANNAWALELGELDDAIANFTRNLQNNISDKVSNVLNYRIEGLNINYQGAISGNILNNNATNISSMQTIQSSKDSDGIVSSQSSIINGVCTNTLIGGDGNNTLSSSGDCDDQFTGGKGADTFSCGVGMDMIRDYNPNEGDVIIDKENCETIL
jgi:Ca2+-binding RTX toxin-like protein